jgi:hypothetical protein
MLGTPAFLNKTALIYNRYEHIPLFALHLSNYYQCQVHPFTPPAINIDKPTNIIQPIKNFFQPETYAVKNVTNVT